MGNLYGSSYSDRRKHKNIYEIIKLILLYSILGKKIQFELKRKLILTKKLVNQIENKEFQLFTEYERTFLRIKLIRSFSVSSDFEKL